MEKFFKSFVLLCIIYLSGLITSCNDDCNPLNSQFSITDFNITESVVTGNSNLFNASEIALNDTIRFNNISINVRASFNTFLANQIPKREFGFGSVTACEPPLLSPFDTVRSIKVTSIEPIGVSSFNTGIDVTSKFDVISFTEDGGFTRRISLSEFNSNEHLGSTSYFLFLNTPPDMIIETGFSVTVNFSNKAPITAASRILFISP